MKKITTLFLLLCSVFATSIYCSAETINNSENITVNYQEDSIWTEAQREQFVTLITSDQMEHVPYSLLCLFGHDEVIEYPCITKHKALSVEPRCAVQYYEVITCTRCDYMDATLLSQAFIFCCPED